MTERQLPRVLDGIRVAEFCHAGVGPLSTKSLADAGAQVIKIESHTRTEVSRRASPMKQHIFHPENSAGFATYNNDKLGITLNLKHPKGVELARRLVAVSDIVADSMSPGVMGRLGFSYDEVRKIKADIIQISMSFAGQTGPYSPQKGHGMVLAALVGLPMLVGFEGGPPLSVSLAYTDFYLPHVWNLAIIGALIHRKMTGKGQYIDGSDLEAVVDVLDTALLERAVNGTERPRLGNRHEWAAPHGCYPCKGDDRWCVIAVFTDEEWRSLCEATGNAALANDPRFATFAKRKENEDALDEILGGWTRDQDAHDVVARLQAAGVRSGVVENTWETMHNPQLAHRHTFWEVPGDPDMDFFTYNKQGYQLSAAPLAIRHPVPRIGQHNEYVFREVLGLSDDELAEYIAIGAID